MRVLSDVLNTAVQTEFPHSRTSTDFTNASLEDKPEVIAKFRPAPARSVHGVDHLLSVNAPTNDFNTTTYGRITFRSVEPIRKEVVVADKRLQERLEMLCSNLRSRY